MSKRMAGIWCTRCWTNMVPTEAAVVRHFNATQGGTPSPAEISATLARKWPIERWLFPLQHSQPEQCEAELVEADEDAEDIPTPTLEECKAAQAKWAAENPDKAKAYAAYLASWSEARRGVKPAPKTWPEYWTRVLTSKGVVFINRNR